MLVHLVSALTLDRTIQYKEVAFSSARVPLALDGYRFAFVSDIHNMTDETLAKIVQKLNAENLDLLVLGGDYSSFGDSAKHTMDALRQIRTKNGVYGVPGNHDSLSDLTDVMPESEVQLLANSGVQVQSGLYLGGVEDLYRGFPDVRTALQGASPSDFRVLLSHNPDVSMLQDTGSVDLVLSGHAHGGQVTLFGMWAPALWVPGAVSNYGQRFLSGWALSADGTPVYVSNGAGTFPGIPRVFARPQVILFTLQAE